MNPAQLLVYFSRMADAPDAVPHLRQFILDLAVRGKLVEQDPKDEPAADLLKQIETEKTHLVSKGEIAKQKLLPQVKPEEVPFGTPPGWEWVRIRQVTTDRGQTTPDRAFTYIDVTAINKEAGCVADVKVLSAADAPSRARKLVQKGDVLYSCVRPYLLNIAVIENDIAPAPIASTAFAVLNGLGFVLPRYLWIALRSPFMVKCVEAKMRGQAYPAINDSDFAALPLPLPPLTEQHRIVAKVDELMALCDHLEAAQGECESRRGRLVAAALQRLNQPAEDATAFRDHARFALDHLPRFAIRSEHIAPLRQTVLSLAFRGELTAERRNANCVTESVAELLSTLKREHAASGSKATRNRRGANAARNEGADADGLDLNLMPDLPESWRYARADEIVEPGTIISYGIVLPGPQVEDGVPYIRGLDIEKGRVLTEQLWRTAPAVAAKHERSRLEGGDVLLCVIRHLKVAIVPPALTGANLTQGTVRLRPSRVVLGRYLALYLESPVAQTWMKSRYFGMDMPRINVADARAIPIAVPPLSEQQHIVAKVEEMMSLCDQLEAHLSTAQTVSRRLLEAVLHKALAPAF